MILWTGVSIAALCYLLLLVFLGASVVYMDRRVGTMALVLCLLLLATLAALALWLQDYREGLL